MKLVTLFPGQGSQYSGMSKPLLDNFAWAKDYYEEASDTLGVNLRKIVEGPDSELTLTANAQPAILVTSYGWFQVLRKELDFQPRLVAGHSLGEYSALLAAGALSLSTAVSLVRKRGELMQNAVPVGTGKMAALLGLDDAVVEALCAEASEGSELVVPANFNAPSQVVIAGHSPAVDRAMALASGTTNPDFKARKAVPLNVSAPFHSPLMKPVAEKFSSHLNNAEWGELSCPIVSNLDAQIRETGDWAQLLTDQVDHPVRWTQSVQNMVGEGYDGFIEMGPGKVLIGLVKRIARGAALFSLENGDDLKKFQSSSN